MDHRKIIFFIVLLAAAGCILGVLLNIFMRSVQQGKLSGGAQGSPLSYGALPIATSSFINGSNGTSLNSGISSITTSSPVLGSGSAFINKGNSGVVLPQNPNNVAQSPAPMNGGSSATTTTTNTTTNAKVTSLSDVRNIISSTALTEQSTTTTSLTLPNVPDSEITIDSAGVSTAVAYLAYFNSHANDIVFNMSEFSNVLKDENGIELFVPDLIEKAIADDNFPEIKSSLIAQKDFIDAEKKFLSSIKVTGNAVSIDKQVIGSEELAENLADEALLAASGSLSRADMVNDYSQFDATISTARNNLVEQSGVLSLGESAKKGVVDNILHFFGLNTPAAAQSAGTPFGGVVSLIIPCVCDLGEIVTIGTPVPAEVFVPAAFLATPLFFPDKANHPGAWWLGLDISQPAVPCTTPPPYCPTVGAGSEIIMAGTSP